jgi:surface protein
MKSSIKNTLGITTKITNDNIKKYVKYYIESKEKLPWDLKDKQINQWNVSRVTDMSDLFKNEDNFNEPLNDWNVSNVINMNGMFADCYRFNGLLNKWNVSRVTNMGRMFERCFNFNHELNSWNVSNVTNMNNMFQGCHIFNQELNSWNVSNVTNMSSMFENCWDFNQPLNSWNVSNVLDMNMMFKYCADFNQPLNSWTINPAAFTFEMFTSCRMMLGTNKPTMPVRVPTAPSPVVDPTQVHKEGKKIKYDELNEFLSAKIGNQVIPIDLNYPKYINDTIKSFISNSLISNPFSGEATSKKEQFDGLNRIMNERLNRFNYNNLTPSIKDSIFYCLNYVKTQSRAFQKAYVDSFIKDCVHAYEGVDGMTCVMGAVERIVFSLLPACATEDNPDCETIIDLIQGKQSDIKSYIRDWYKLHKNLASSSGDPFPTDEDDRRANLKAYLLEKLPGQERLIDENIENFANHIGYEDDDFNVSYGGRTRTMNRRINKRKTNKRNTNKRKTNKRKTNKRKTKRRK